MVGGSVGGLFAAHLLRSIGWDVEVFERSAGDLAGRGAGIGATDALLDVMQRIGAPFDTSVSSSVGSRICLDRRGNVIAEVAAADRPTAWARVYRALKDALPPARHHFNLAVRRVDQDAHGVTAEFSDGSQITVCWSPRMASIRRYADNSCPRWSHATLATSPGAVW